MFHRSRFLTIPRGAVGFFGIPSSSSLHLSRCFNTSIHMSSTSHDELSSPFFPTSSVVSSTRRSSSQKTPTNRMTVKKTLKSIDSSFRDKKQDKVIQLFKTRGHYLFCAFGNALLQVRDELKWPAQQKDKKKNAGVESFRDPAVLSDLRSALSDIARGNADDDGEFSQEQQERAAAIFALFLFDHRSLSRWFDIATELCAELEKHAVAFDEDALMATLSREPTDARSSSVLTYARKNAVKQADSAFGRLQKRNIFLLAPRGAVTDSLGARTLDPGFWIEPYYTHQAPGPNRTATSKPSTTSMSRSLNPGLVNFFGGPSGSGKTASAILASGDKSIVIYCLPHLLWNDDIKEKDSEEAKRRFKTLVANAVDDYYTADNNSNHEISKLWHLPMDDGYKIHVVVDEAVNHPQLTLQLCRDWKAACQKWLAQVFRCKSENTFLSIVGTGIEKMSTSTGSIASKFQTFFIVPNHVFSAILKEMSSSLEHEEKVQKLAALVFNIFFKEKPQQQKSTEIVTAEPRDIVEHRFIQLTSTNARCAVLAIAELLTLPRPVTWNEATIREHLFAISLAVMTRFASINGLQNIASEVNEDRHKYLNQKKSDSQKRCEDWTARSLSDDVNDWIHLRKLDVIGNALKISISRADSMSDDEWNTFAGKYGLIADGASWIPAKLCDEKKYTVVEKAQGADSSKFYHFAYRKDELRWKIPEAVVVMFLTGFGRTLVGKSGFGAAKGKYFETAIADFIYMCWKLGVVAPTQLEKTKRRNRDFTSPHHLFGLMDRAATGHLATCFRGELLHPLEESTFSLATRSEGKQWLESQKEVWRRIVMTGQHVPTANATNQVPPTASPTPPSAPIVFDKQHYGAVILENCGLSIFADVIAMTPGRLILIQCKYYHDANLKSRNANRGFATQEQNGECLNLLLDCCRVGNEQVRIDSVLAGAHPEQFTGKIGVTTTSRASVANVAIHRHLITAFTEKDTKEPSSLYPVLQFPLVDRAVTEEYMSDPLPQLELEIAFEKKVGKSKSVAKGG